MVKISPSFLTPPKKRTPGRNKEYSVSYILKKQGRLNDDFEIMLNNLTLEEVIGLKLELAGRVLKNKPYGLQVWKFLPDVIRDAVLRYALSASNSYKDAADFLGINVIDLRKLIKKYTLTDFFEEPHDTSNHDT